MPRRFLDINILRRLSCWLIASYIRWVYHSGRWDVFNGQVPRRLMEQGQPFIAVFWHGRMLMMPCLWFGEGRLRVLASQHRDGALVAGIVAHFGIGNLRGSSSRGGTAAMALLAETLESGVSVAITPDGPRGPAERASPGVVTLARYCGVPIVPVSTAARRCWRLASWDGLLIPQPFAGGVFCFGEPLRVPRQADVGTCKAARRALEDSLKRLGRQAGAALTDVAGAHAAARSKTAEITSSES